MDKIYSPWYSLQEGHWFKLICGASFQDLPAIRSLTLAYTLAGADCIDVAADPAVITAAQEAISVAEKWAEVAKNKGFSYQGRPWLMVSLNDAEDPHFRKAQFDPHQCPANCSRPCEVICPAHAIANQGVIDVRCYGCGRCLPVCPLGLITTRSYVSTPAMIEPLIKSMGIEAIEIHTQVGHEQDFQRLWQAISPWSNHLKLLAISCQNHPHLIDYLRFLKKVISPLSCPLIWQTDGRPMSGDISKGTTHAAIKMAQKVLKAKLPGFVQLAGGTNYHTVTKLKQLGLLKNIQNESPSEAISGIAYGSYARSLLLPILERLDSNNQPLESEAGLLWEAVNQAHTLVKPLKSGL